MSVRASLAIVETAYRLDGSTDEWLTTVLHAARPTLERGLGLVGMRFRVTEESKLEFDGPPAVVGPVPAAFEEFCFRTPSALGPPQVRNTWAHPLALDTSSAARAREPGVEELFDAERSRLAERVYAAGVRDSVVAKMVDADRNGCLLGAPLPRECSAQAGEEARWRLVMAHLMAALRLRRRLARGDGDAVVAPDGRVVHAQSGARPRSARDALRRAALAVDRARSSKGRRDPDAALQAWQGLVSGRWSLVDRFDSDGRRYLIARRNDPTVAWPSSLSERERQVAAFAALGHTNKRIAYTLGLSPSTVSSHLRSAMRRLGVESTQALADLFASR